MRIDLMRHGPAEDYASTGRDADRELTARGRERVRAVARLLAEAGELPLRIHASPLARARQTAEEVGRIAAGAPLDVEPDLAPGRADLALVLAYARAGREGALLVGHEPDLGDLACALTGLVLPGLDKGMVVSVEVSLDPSGPSGLRSAARFVLDPRALTLTRA